MATYLKRTSKLFDLSLSRPSADVHLRDLMCPVCRGILIEPVTLPCTHNLCLRCLKGTFEHNSLSCPLCRLRVGSWLRTATKSETLVNHGLWEFIRAKFPKEVEDKHNGEERNLGLDADFATKRILSAAGEIHREYEVQLQLAEEELRRQRQAEQMASEAFIQKIQAEEQQQLLVQLAQDQLLAKTLAKRQVADKQKEVAKCYNEPLSTSMSNYTFDVASKFNAKVTHVNNVEAPQTETAHLESRRINFSKSTKDNPDLGRTNMALLSKIRAERCGKVKANASNAYKDCCPKATYNAIANTFKHQAISKFVQPCASSYSAEPGCSTSRTYITETKEELRVPSDVVNSKKKSLGVEVCMTHRPFGSHRTDDDERIGSAESSGSHDSINQEIHHFKPIKTVPRTSLKISDGKQIDPKLIKVIPVMKRAINAVLKPPSPTHLKRTIGCSWSAFRGRARQDAKEKLNLNAETSIDQKPSTSLNHSQTVSNKWRKPQTNDARLDFTPELSFDSNKNYAKNANRIVNGTKVSKKLSLDDDESDGRRTRKSWRRREKNSVETKSKQHRDASGGRKRNEHILNAKDEEGSDPRDSSSPFDQTSLRNNEQDGDDDVAVENIAERIKKRKINVEKKKQETESDASASKWSTRKNVKKRLSSERRDESYASTEPALVSSRENAKSYGKSTSRAKRQRTRGTSRSNSIPEKSDPSTDAVTSASGSRRSARNPTSTKVSSKGRGNESDDRYNGGKFDYDSPPESCDETEERVSEESNAVGSRIGEKHDDVTMDNEIIEEQQRIERLLLQEREDFELARHLQAKFDEMERVAGRTRRSKRIVEGASGSDVADSHETGATARTVRKASDTPCTVKRPIVDRTENTMPKKCGRPPKRVK